MAQDVSELPQSRETEEELQLLPDRRERARRSSYRFRFGILYVLLAAVVGAGIGSFIVLATQPGPAKEAAWSSWRPEGRVNAYPVEIAQYVGSRYRLPSGKQLVGVLAGAAEIQDLPLRAVVIQHDASDPTKSAGPARFDVSFRATALAASRRRSTSSSVVSSTHAISIGESSRAWRSSRISRSASGRSRRSASRAAR